MRIRPFILAFFLGALAAAFTPAALRVAHAQEDVAATPSPVPIPSPKATAEDPKVHKLAVTQFLAWQQGQVNRALYSDEFNSQLTDPVLNDAEATLARMGGLQSVTFRGISVAKGLSVFVYHMVCEHDAIDMDFALQPDGKIALLLFQ